MSPDNTTQIILDAMNNPFFYSDLATEVDDMFVHHLLGALSSYDNQFLQQTAKDYLIDSGQATAKDLKRWAKAEEATA